MRAIIPSGTHAPIAPFSPGMMADNVIYVLGHAGIRCQQRRRP